MRKRISLELAERIASKVFELAEVPVAVAICDGFGWLVLFERNGDAPPSMYELARDKAWTAAVFGVPTEEVSKFGEVNRSNWNDRATTVPGGVPIVSKEGEILGGLGIAGGTPEEDKELAKKVLESIDGL